MAAGIKRKMPKGRIISAPTVKRNINKKNLHEGIFLLIFLLIFY